MNYRNWTTTIIISALVMVSSSSYSAGLLTPVSSSYQPLEIKTHDVEVLAQDGYAVTQVIQTFFNPNTQDLEANYSFPVPQDASVGEFTYWINGQAITGEVVEKEQAQEIYQQQKANGRHTALTEQDDYRSFNVKVYPVRANDQVKIKLVYFQQLKIDTEMGRYVYPLEEGGVDQAASSFWSRNDTVTERFSFIMDIRSSYPLDGVRLPQQSQALLQQIDDKQWRISYHSNNEESNKVTKLDQDIVVYWRHQADLPGSVDLVAYRAPDQKQGTFMLTLTPGDDLAASAGARDWIFVLDKSGSMSGKYATLIEGVRQGLDKLPQGDRFRIITFNNNAFDVTSGYQTVSPENVSRALAELTNQGVDGGTNLYAGLKMGLTRLDDDHSSAVILVTDGVANVGTTEKKAFLKLLDSNDVRLYSFIMGNSANRPLLEGMTKRSNGFFANISNSDDIMGKIMLATSKMTHQALRDIQLNIDGIKIGDLTPQKISTLYRGQQLTILGHYYGQGQAKIKLTGEANGQKLKYQTEINFPHHNIENPQLERLWAYSKIKDLEDMIDYLGADEDIKQAIVDLSIEYGLVTNYTSLLVVEQEVFEQLGIKQSNKRRIELESQAHIQRKQAVIKSNRADNKQPMFTTSRPSTGGGGAINEIWILALLSLMLIRWIKAQRSSVG